MHRTEGDGNVANLFSPGDPFIPTPATQLTADWCNAVQEELALTVEGLGGTLNTAASDVTPNQLLTRLNAKFGRLDLANSWAAAQTFVGGVSGNTTFTNNVSVGGSLAVTASSTLTGPLTANGTTRINAMLGLNAAPSFPLDIGDTGAVGNALVRVGSGMIPLFLLSDGGFNYVGVGFNTYYNTTDTRAVSGYCSDFAQSSDGVVRLRTGGTGAAGSVVLTEKLRIPQTAAATTTAANAALVLPNGHLSLDGTTAPNSNVSLKNTLTPNLVVKAYVSFQPNAAGPVLLDGANIASIVNEDANIVLITFAQAFASSNYVVTYGHTDPERRPKTSAKSTTTLRVSASNSAGASAPIGSGTTGATTTIDVMIIGRQ